MKGILGRKLGMTEVFEKNGKLIPVTVIDVEPNVVTQIKTDRELVPIYNITYVELEKEYFISFDITTFLKNEQHPVIFSFMVAIFKVA